MTRKPDIVLTLHQRERLENLWGLYGTNGPKHTMKDHKFIQKILEKGQDWRGLFNPTEACLLAVEAVLPKLRVGDMVIIPDRFRLRNKRQSRANVILAISPERGRRYLKMTKILKSGKPSQDPAAEVYWHLDNAHYLERMTK